MSNDISPSRLPPTAAALPSNPVAKAEEAPRPVPVEVAQPATPPKTDHKETRRQLEEATEHLNQQMKRNSRDLSFSVDDVSNRVVVTVKNREGEVVRQIPNEVVLRVAHNMEDIKGLLQDDKS